MWRIVLADAGVTVDAVDPDHVRLHHGDQSQTALLRELTVVTPSKVPDHPGEPALLAAPKMTSRCLDAAVAKGWMAASGDGLYSIKVGHRELDSRSLPPTILERPRRHPGPPSWALLTIARRLLAIAPATGSELAAASRISQSRVSRTLARLAENGLVERVDSHYLPVDWRRLFDWWLLEYPGPGGTISYWASVESIAIQTRTAVAALADQGCRAAVSGDPAADLLAPWRLPSLATVYADRGTPLGKHGFVLVASEEEATLVVRSPADPGLWLPSEWAVGGLPLADPLQITYDIINGSEPDRDEAAEELIEKLQTRHKALWGRSVGKNRS